MQGYRPFPDLGRVKRSGIYLYLVVYLLVPVPMVLSVRRADTTGAHTYFIAIITRTYHLTFPNESIFDNIRVVSQRHGGHIIEQTKVNRERRVIYQNNLIVGGSRSHRRAGLP